MGIEQAFAHEVVEPGGFSIVHHVFDETEVAHLIDSISTINVFDFAHGQSPVGQTDSPFQGEAHLPVLLSSAAPRGRRPEAFCSKPISIPEREKSDRFRAGTAIGFSPEC